MTAILGAGIGVLLACTINDILHNRGWIRTLPLEHVGMFAFIFAQAMVLALVNMRARRTAEALARGLGRFVPREFTRLLGKEEITDVELGDAVHREVTVVFCDLRGFTGLSERIEVREVFALLNAVYDRLGPLVREHRGFVDKYIGDAIMALFPGDPSDAVAAAAAIAEAVGEVILPGTLARTARGERPRLAVGVGIHRGPVMLGTIGERERMEATVIADAVNVASRLEGLSKRLGATILLSDEVLRALPGGALPGSRALGRIRLAGKRQSVGVHELYAADPPALRAIKERSAPAFEAALAAFQAGEFASAAARFRELAEAYPEDRAAAVYAESAAALALAPPASWDGALEIRGK
ncbi:MAG: adenylate/guanylate cyclase domain-containing protein [Myxococcales bacterium]|nr:adenylate/guanylate cyclase domain-containing protein [Myxococcales bacterium]